MHTLIRELYPLILYHMTATILPTFYIFGW